MLTTITLKFVLYFFTYTMLKQLFIQHNATVGLLVLNIKFFLRKAIVI